jgi:hypothetical protein
MLNKSVCWKCHQIESIRARSAGRPPDAQELSRPLADAMEEAYFEKNWNSGKVICHTEGVWNIVSSEISGDPPENCPKKLEHALALGMAKDAE